MVGKRCMLKLKRKTGYALIALHHIATLEEGRWASAHSISEIQKIPPDLLAKVMQSLKRGGYVRSVQGSQGGYALACAPHEAPFLTFLEFFQEQVALTECAEGQISTCVRYGNCPVCDSLNVLNARLTNELRRLTLGDIVGPGGTLGSPQVTGS